MIEKSHTQAEFRRLVHQNIELAEKLYGIDFGRVTVTFDLKGEDAAHAYQVPHPNLGFIYKLRFNREAIRLDWIHMVESTIPHEVAHLVAFARDDLGADGHNWKWRAIAIALGDTERGKNHHTLPLKPARRVRRFLYMNDRGSCSVTPGMHHKVQAGLCDIEYLRNRFTARDFQRMVSG